MVQGSLLNTAYGQGICFHVWLDAPHVPIKTLLIDGNCRVEDRGLKTHHGHPRSCSRTMKAVGVVEATCEEIFELVMSMDGTRFE
ncbi:hypothetical protein Fmac_025665 [Flemingia macrophylla]|uniref:Uncharacterized protein n=1 Tax=Flemingia macrophylla TaxID=520843 RepID=A0ABD1LSV3_9FABA